MRDTRLERLYAEAFPDTPLTGWHLTDDGCEALHINSRVLPVAVVGHTFSADKECKWFADFYGREDMRYFETKEEARAYAIAIGRMLI